MNYNWKEVTRRDGGDTEAMRVPGGAVLKHVQPGPLEESPWTVAMVFVPMTDDAAAVFFRDL